MYDATLLLEMLEQTEMAKIAEGLSIDEIVICYGFAWKQVEI